MAPISTVGRGDMGESILHHAAAGGNVNGINSAIRHGSNVNDRDLEGATPLAYALRMWLRVSPFYAG